MLCSYLYFYMVAIGSPYYDACRVITDIFKGYSEVARMYVGFQYFCHATLLLFIITVVFFRYLIKFGLDLSYGRLPTADPSTIKKLSWAFGFIVAFGLGNFAILILNPISALILFTILFIVFIRLARKR